MPLCVRGVLGERGGGTVGRIELGEESALRLVEYRRAGRGPLGAILIDILFEDKLAILVGVFGTAV